MDVEEAIFNTQSMPQHGTTIHGLLVEKLSSNEFIRRGCIRPFATEEDDDYLNYAALLQMWLSTPEESITLL